jgi:hypothetical protein
MTTRKHACQSVTVVIFTVVIAAIMLHVNTAYTLSIHNAPAPGNLTYDQLCYSGKYVNTTDYDRTCSEKAKQRLQQAQDYINDESYYYDQHCKPKIPNSLGHVKDVKNIKSWNCPPGTESIHERLLTGNKTYTELCQSGKYVNTKAYAQTCK